MQELLAILIIIFIYYKISKLIFVLFKKLYYIIKKQYLNINCNYKKSYNKYNKKKTIKLSTTEKGKIGEDNLIYYLELDLTYYKKILKNLYIPIENDNTTEIDVIQICNYGIFVFEVKNYKGSIYGYRKYNTWYQTFENGKTYEFNNPINQNYFHIEKLKNILNINKENLYKSVVYFTGNEEIKTYIENKESDYVLTKKDYNLLNPLIKENNIKLLTDFEVDEIYNKLKCYANADIITKLNHINRLNSNKNI